MILETGILTHTILLPHTFGFIGAIIGALGAWGAGSAISATALTAMQANALLIGGGLLGASTQAQASSARKAAEQANDATEARFYYDTEGWLMNKDKLSSDHEKLYKNWEAAVQNEQTLANWKDATNRANYFHQLQIAQAQDESNAKQFAKSENIYGQQIVLNELNASAAKRDELMQLDEIHTEAAFDRQDASLQALKDEGTLRARGIEGRSIGKGKQAVLADYGRQMALLSESLSSAGRNTKAVLQEIEREHFSADLTAFANKMLKPGETPKPPIPYATPVAVFPEPRPLEEFDYGPAPVMGHTVSPGAASTSVWGSTVSGIAGSAVGGMLASAFSDVGLKENLEYIEKSPSGINIYEWNYKGESNRYRGAIAQDLIAQGRLDAVSEQDNGYLAVDYSKLDVQMTPV